MTKVSLRAFAAAVCFATLAAGVRIAAAPRPPAFELHTLGVLGGDTDTNLSCFLLGRPGSPDLVMIDAGSIMPGLMRWLEREGKLPTDASPSVRARAALDTFDHLRGVFLTHSHLDHWGGLADSATLFMAQTLRGRPSMPIYALPATLETLRVHLFQSALWADFTAIPASHPAFVLKPIGETDAGGFHVQAIPVHHAVPGAAFLIRSGDAAYLHFGDTSATQAAWDAARPLLASKQLRAVSLEVSFPAAQERLAESSGHLTRSSFLLELAKLAGIQTTIAAREMTDAEAVALAAKLAPSFRDCPVFVIHVKALGYDRVKAEVAALQKAGLNLVMPVQGETYRF